MSKNEQKFKIHWASKSFDPRKRIEPDMLGYHKHITELFKQSKKLLSFDNNAKTAITIDLARDFCPVPGKHNILFTMWEWPELPSDFIEGAKKADALICPSYFCKEVFSRYTSAPVDVCPEGVDPEKYRFYRRIIPGKNKRFRFLWLGTLNPRKGIANIIEAARFVETRPDMELYIKTTAKGIKVLPGILQKVKAAISARGAFLGDLDVLEEHLTQGASDRIKDKVTCFGRNRNIIVDVRYLPESEIISLYNSAHCFLFPTFGEGFGLPLCEAMATGCPSIAAPVTGVADFFDDPVGFPIKWNLKEKRLEHFNFTTMEHTPDVSDLLEKMRFVHDNYEYALEKGRSASDRIRSRFTWENSALRLSEILAQIQLSAEQKNII